MAGRLSYLYSFLILSPPLLLGWHGCIAMNIVHKQIAQDAESQSILQIINSIFKIDTLQLPKYKLPDLKKPGMRTNMRGGASRPDVKILIIYRKQKAMRSPRIHYWIGC